MTENAPFADPVRIDDGVGRAGKTRQRLNILNIRFLQSFAVLALAGCATVPATPPVASAAQVATPADTYGALFAAVQERRIFPDGKTFVDATPRRPVAAIMRDYAAGDFATDDALRAFVLVNFDVPSDRAAPADAARPPLAEHIRVLWPQLTRPPVQPGPGSTALPLPRSFVVPGGRFREIYYWDSYFTMLGLRADGQDALIEGMIDDFVSLVERYGHVPNGARTYYLSRSQPPFLYLMMGLSRATDPAVKARRLTALRREHAYWTTPERSIITPDGAELQHYWDARETPRDESWREDVETAKASGRPLPEVYRHLRAGAESGWDYSSRWLADGRTLTTIDTTNIVPVDLNSLLWGLERAIADGCRGAGDAACVDRFAALAATRGRAIENWLWDDAGGRYGDWDMKRQKVRPGITAATVYPLFAGLARPDRAARVATTIARDLLAPNGLRTTTVDTGQQWDKPNGWAPLQWVAADGLRRYGRDDLAQQIASRFVATAEREYRASGKLLEKYDVERSRAGSGGEYPTQDGFGWTNGVIRAFQERYAIR
ncbi:alpha,alpha-trehalase TreF [Sphingomonas sp. SUN019]|uniref:alpha,alpha-trehalase TreF n=1 Tax=Sphingomonas sp. SUN019 TaxID=2937788 RepID=UPI002164C4BC|nr:alpha,alpha-trehalase TreF [Sphingomonas sp. SUN019]UVO50412.1 alpha,alpha-trehalase TreF [Sphingomonas sp. SUN019]